MRRGTAVDVLVAVVAAAAGVTLELSRPAGSTHLIAAPVWVYVTAQVVAAGLLLARRRRPYTMALLIAMISVVAPAWAAMPAPYAVTAHGGGPRGRQWAVIAVLTVAFLAGAQAWTVADPFSAPLVIVSSALLGMYMRARRNLVRTRGDLVAELTERAERAERERLLLAERARADERIRLAGEMHDAVTHRINLIVLQAGALRVSTGDPAVRAAAEEMRVAGCQALAELRDLVGVLRRGEDATDGAAEPDLAALVAESRAVGLAVRLVQDGDPGVVAPVVRRTLFRLVQESLTNVHKHAPGAGARVAVRYAADAVHATVSNTPRQGTPDPDLAAAGGGSGLDGLRRRVEVVGGTLTAGSTADGGFAVSATLPVYVPTAARG
jgi:signal transduction histidine kinase